MGYCTESDSDSDGGGRVGNGCGGGAVGGNSDGEINTLSLSASEGLAVEQSAELTSSAFFVDRRAPENAVDVGAGAGHSIASVGVEMPGDERGGESAEWDLARLRTQREVPTLHAPSTEVLDASIDIADDLSLGTDGTGAVPVSASISETALLEAAWALVNGDGASTSNNNSSSSNSSPMRETQAQKQAQKQAQAKAYMGKYEPENFPGTPPPAALAAAYAASSSASTSASATASAMSPALEPLQDALREAGHPNAVLNTYALLGRERERERERETERERESDRPTTADTSDTTGTTGTNATATAAMRQRQARGRSELEEFLQLEQAQAQAQAQTQAQPQTLAEVPFSPLTDNNANNAINAVSTENNIEQVRVCVYFYLCVSLSCTLTLTTHSLTHY